MSCQPRLTGALASAYVDNVARMAELSKAVDSRDPAVGLAAVASLRLLVDELETLHVANARNEGWSWQAVAEALGVSRQAVHKKHRAGSRRAGR